MSGQPVRLGSLEQQVMDALWDSGESTVREIINTLPTASAYTTIATVLHNLDRKKLVRARRRHRSVHYRARLSRDEYTAQLMNHALSSSKDRAASILHFVDTISDEDAALLREYLQRPREEDLP